jgi:peptide deformylase
VLRTRSDEIDTIDDEIRELIENLFETMYAAKGIGLAANQVGLTHRVAVVDSGDTPPLTLINPTIVDREGKIRAEEGCLSIPDLFGDVDRAKRIVVETTSLESERVRFEVFDMTARAVQHEIDHLDGIVFLDRLSPLRRRMLLKKWKKLRKDESSYIQEVSASRSTK